MTTTTQARGAMIQRILSYGGGVQSECIARMSLDGELPLLDHIIFADTGAEWPGTYETADRIEKACSNRGVKFHRVKCELSRSTGSITKDMLRDGPTCRWSAPPVFLADTPGQVTGQTMRQCTSDYKKKPIEMCIKTQILGLKRRAHWPKEPSYELWLGISGDEMQRMKAPQRRAERIYHPLIEQPMIEIIDRPYRMRQPAMHRSDCKAWLERNGYCIPPKSACTICPYQSRKRWRELAKTEPAAFEEACRIDNHIREISAFKGTPYLHRDGIPLREIDLREPNEVSGQGDMLDGFDDECSGFCGV